ncbi:TIR domain-containing protein [Lentibacillus sp. CBA3610]|uniref:TIR domain-containing protein n=1 Tax=Lentibacillus sp. CBA3610 TaxID=2518176 RepID=UPI0015958420|nr:nucleotide-binding protein [Lentibacillus sp. CBA3610]QKY70285.1 nucleotide-binding protein [Lentibacillus sp. CBA3610]
MSTKRSIKLVDDLLQKTESLNFEDQESLEEITEEAKMLIRNLFEINSDYLRSVNSTSFHSPIFPSSPETDRTMWDNGKRSYISIFKAMKRELELFGDEEEQQESSVEIDFNEKNVFIVHGHDEAMKQTIARTVSQLKLNPIILSEQNDDGKTVIEKFESHASDSKFAIILLSPDDFGYKRSNSPETGAFRARQNVILELGYFIGKLGRKNVIAIVKDDPSSQLEVPSDLAGLIYTQFDNTDGWKLKLVKRLKSCGYNVSADDL